MDYKILLILLLVLLGTPSSVGINCFICSSTEKAGCGDDFRILTSDANSRQECYGSCVKRRGERVTGSVRRIEVTRSCIIRRSEGCYREVNNGLNVYSCACNSEFCNLSSRVTYSLSIILLMSLCMLL